MILFNACSPWFAAVSRWKEAACPVPFVPRKFAREVDDAARQLAQAGRLDLTHEFIQHGDVTVYAHVTSVARASLSFAERLGRAGISVDRASLLRGALLHDYFLYDWHDPDPSHRLHGISGIPIFLAPGTCGGRF